MTKMTDEELRLMRERQESRLLSQDEREMWDHVAALTAERDEWKQAHDTRAANHERLGTLYRGLCDERDALRERVKSRHGLGGVIARYTGRPGPEMLAALERYLFGDDTTAPSELDGLESEMAEVDCDVDGKGRAVLSTVPVEPTTAEAFATVRGALHSFLGLIRIHYAQREECDGSMERGCLEGLSAVSLLERRFGALESALRANTARDRETIDRALTDAPLVFTLEEVKEALDKAGVSEDEKVEVRAHLKSRR